MVNVRIHFSGPTHTNLAASEPQMDTASDRMHDTMVMNEISVQRAKELALQKDLVPGRKINREGLQFAKRNRTDFIPLTWEECERVLSTRDLSIYGTGGWLKIRKRK